VIDAKSADTRVEMRDNDVRSDHFLDVANIDHHVLSQKHVAAAGSGKLKVTGDLRYTAYQRISERMAPPPMKDPMGNPHMGRFGERQNQSERFWMTGHGAMSATK